MLELKMLSSLEKIFPDEVGEECQSFTAMRNEPLSFQVAYRNADKDRIVQPFYVKIESDFDINFIAQYKIGYVPVLNCTNTFADDFNDRITPGLYPDPLFLRGNNDIVENDGFWSQRFYEQNEKNQLSSYRDSWQGLWFTVNESNREISSGEHFIKIAFHSSDNGKIIGEKTAQIYIANGFLPKQELIYTSWFHNDCLADIYNVEIFSDRYFEIMHSFVEEAAKTGMNMIMLPAFTPPLDTPVGKERKTTQLVGVSVTEKGYLFDFSLMKKYIDISRDCGINLFEHSHLFTQWGAKAAPKIMATTSEGIKQIFGWETDSKSAEYSQFLKEYLRALMKFLSDIRAEKKVFFHISDEPMEEHIEYYRNAKKVIENEINGYMSGDALSHYDFFEDGTVKTPIVSVDSKDMKKFEKSCDDFWVYYTGESMHSGYSNRCLTNTGTRIRIIGIQMYVAGANGFLHWGYNYYYDVLSHGLFNPFCDPCGYGGLPGTSYVVYPSADGTAISSLRMKILYEGINDYRILKLLERKIGRGQVLLEIEKFFGNVDFRFCPNGEKIIEFRKYINLYLN